MAYLVKKKKKRWQHQILSGDLIATMHTNSGNHVYKPTNEVLSDHSPEVVHPILLDVVTQVF